MTAGFGTFSALATFVRGQDDLLGLARSGHWKKDIVLGSLKGNVDHAG